MAPNTEQALNNYTRARREAHAILIEAARISWPSVSTPDITWHCLAKLPADSDEATLMLARKKILRRTRYFALCMTCNELNAQGYMFSKHMCQGCASRVLGVVY